MVALIDEDQQNHLRLADGSFGAVRLLGPAQRGLRLPHPAVSNGRVWVVDADDVLQQRTVQGLRRLDADSWWLPSEDGGLDEGERVVLRPTADLVPGLRVIVQSAEAEDHSL